jgi:hypothetical protein
MFCMAVKLGLSHQAKSADRKYLRTKCVGEKVGVKGDKVK